MGLNIKKLSAFLYNSSECYTERGCKILKTEEGWKMYIEIQELKKKGFSKSKIASMLKISRPTVIKYINMTPDEFNQEMLLQKSRSKKPDVYHDEILNWLRQYPMMSAAQMYDWLEEKYQKLNFNDSTLRSYVRTMRQDYNIPKELYVRQYEAVSDPPMGKQMQVDFGEKKVCTTTEKEIILYVMCFVLSHSRYKYCKWQNRPFTTIDIIRIHEDAFEFYGGHPEEIVYDQDHLILVSENHGDLIYTKEFAAYLQKRKFKVYMCRRADPETKGRIEKVVDFVKNNFASHRTFINIDRWNEDCLKWLERRGNGKMHSTTRKIPAEVFQEERKYLQPVSDKIISKSTSISITYQVRKDNTVPIQGNRYTVPRGTYKGPHTYVGVNKLPDNRLIIFELESNKELAHYEIPETKGNLVGNNNHKRDYSKKIVQLTEKTVSYFSDNEKAATFIENIQKEKPRYIRDQLALIETVAASANEDSVNKALDYCMKYKLFSAVDFKDAVAHYDKTIESKTANKSASDSKSAEVSGKIRAIRTQIRDIEEYIKIISRKTGG